MSLPLELLASLQAASPAEAWAAIFAHAWDVFTTPVTTKNPAAEITRRDRQFAAVDLFLATAGWDLWQEFSTATTSTADALAEWWQAQSGGCAVLILDALSLREAAWIIAGAQERGYRMNGRVTAAELPADTTPFARALGFAQRSALENNGASQTHRLPGAHTDCVKLPWADCAALIGAQPRWVLWHEWPDVRLHDYAEPGKGGQALAAEAAEKLTDDAFWLLIERLTTGRKLVITADHGYAATGLFPDTQDDQQAKHLKEVFKGGRWAAESASLPAALPTLPPLELSLETRHGRNRFALGRRKWKSQGGYPTLAHGGLSVLEVAVPFIELGR